mmetsp:Transcript_16519/g.24981  ORF Transcript_16519/g.24981 Transcript_16519/m.24981 type:complete len:215 (-) Transcript_16519:397-1041(-)|eukprot:CAMPEP_0178910092 /NCGR_PEP_ID=MMETSP0786-20121207/8903_1 /TAXON_ID=186022 /ORGANISM="Thalassionema frauenfeldii, Strain CCMP 1798" /LENGTH=214 /DNA_ID=CAMNT_0020582301 /DNA_START=6 /DNA_END=650 /DNA_ORIENTATION=+
MPIQDNALLHDAIQNYMQEPDILKCEIIKLLKEGRANPNSCHMGLTPLSRATTLGQVDVVVLLLENGADPNYQNPKENDCLTPLTYATMLGNDGIVRSLLDYGADPNLQNGLLRHTAPLHWAVKFRQENIISLLLNFKNNRGADPNLPMMDGWTPLQCAVLDGADAMVDILLPYLKEPDIIRLNDDCKSSIGIAREKGRKEELRRLIVARLQRK